MATLTDERAAILCGRDDELRRLADAFTSARDGQPMLALVDGPPGIGKTALVRRFAEDHAARTLWASGDVYERAVPFAVADQLLRRAQLDSPRPPRCPSTRSTTPGSASPSSTSSASCS